MPTPQIAMIPSGYKAGKVYSVLPLDGSADFDFTRASGKTRVNKDGLIELLAANVPPLDYTGGGCPSLNPENQSTNLIIYSEDFSDSSWGKFRGSILLNTTKSPNASITASSFIEDSTNNTHVLRFSSTTNTNAYTFSFFVKSLSQNRKIVLSAGSASAFAIFDIDNGILESSSNINGSSILNYGNGWYRCSVSKLNPQNDFDLRLNNGLGDNYLGDGVSGVFVWGAQLEEQSSASSHIPTNGTSVTRLADEPTLNLSSFTLTSITETIGGVEQTPITVIPSTYTMPFGAINKIEMI
jgi:hypothetical protein